MKSAMEKTGKRQVAECTVNAINRGRLDKLKTITVLFLFAVLPM